MEQKVTHQMEKEMAMNMLKQVNINLEKGEIKPIDLRAITITLMNVVELVYDPLIAKEQMTELERKAIQEILKNSPHKHN